MAALTTRARRAPRAARLAAHATLA
ncbi:MAG: hypothetical protein JWN84_663, partial [Nocardioides sp.]|nr:hypothetical protein [Nocardioides sp.]